MAILRFVTHPQVRISADIPVPRWGLNDIGRARAEALTKQPWLATTTRLISSAETKALETAAIIAAANGLTIEVREQFHENDRSSTGFVPPDRFEVLADAFFANPNESVEGWETANTAQQRIKRATADLRTNNQGDIVIIAHGAVGTLLLCDLLRIPITRTEDQVGGEAAPGGGNYWSYDQASQTVLHRWRPIDS
jgi:broad specificity phosphatase PhoE